MEYALHWLQYYITIQVLVLVYTRCVPEAQGNCDVLPIAQVLYLYSISRLKPVKRSYARHSPLAWCMRVMHWSMIIDALIAGRRFLPRHINHIPTHPHYTVHTHTRQATNIQLHNGKIKQHLHNGNSTKSNRMQRLYNSISGATE